MKKTIGKMAGIYGASLNHHVAAALVLLKAYKLQRYDPAVVFEASRRIPLLPHFCSSVP